MGARIRVIAAAAVLRTSDGSERYLYRDAMVPPDGFDEKSIEHAVSVNLVELVEVSEDDEDENDTDQVELPTDDWNHAKIDAWAAAQEPPIELVDPGTSKQFVKADKLAQIAAQLEARKTQQ